MENLILETELPPEDIRVRLVRANDSSARDDLSFIMQVQRKKNPETDISQEIRNAIRLYAKHLQDELGKNLE